MEVRQRQIRATADIDQIPARKRISFSNRYTEQPRVDNAPYYEDYGSMIRLIPSTPDVDDRYYGYSDESVLQSGPDEDMSPSSSIIDVMESLFIEHDQSEIQNATANTRQDQFAESSVIPGRNIGVHEPAERVFKTSKGGNSTQPFEFIWRMSVF